MDSWWQAWQNLAEFVAPGNEPGMETTRSHSWPWSPAVTVLLLVAAGSLVLALYGRERGAGGRPLKAVLAGLRLALIALVTFMMYGWMLHRHRTDLPDLVVLIDDSQSMGLEDHYDDPARRSQLEKRLRALDLSGLTRLKLAQLLLLEQDGQLVRQLAGHYNVKVYLVGGSARSLAPAESDAAATPAARAWEPVFRGLEPRETSSRLGKGLRDVLESQRGRPTAAVILLTDGVTTEGKTIGEVADYARRKAIPLFLVGLGNDQPPRDLRLDDLLVDETVFVGDQVNFDFRLTASGFEGRKVLVRLKRADGSGAVLAEEAVPAGPDGEPRSVRLSHRPEQQGDFEYRVEAETLEGEASAENNALTRLVKVRDETLRVLLVQEGPSYEFRFLKSMLGRARKRQSGERSIELATVLQEADLEYAESDETALRVFPVGREELFRYDVLIFGDANPSFLSRTVLENIVAFVEQRGGGLVVIAGPRHTPLAYRDTPLARLLPVDIETAAVPPRGAKLNKPAPIQPTKLGLATPQLQLESTLGGTLQAWREMPGFYWLMEAPDVKPGTRVLAVDPTRTAVSGENLPVICMQFVGAGKVILHATDESYRWSRHPAGEQYYARYWTQTIRYLSRAKLLEGSRAAELTSDRLEYRRGDPVRIRVRFFDDRLAPEQDDAVRVVLEQDSAGRREISLHRDAATRGIFEGTIGNLGEGRYRAWIAAPTLDGRPPSQVFTVTAPPGEMARLQMDAADLQMAAKISQGRFYTLDRAGRLLEDLPRGRQVRIESLPPQPIWNSAFLAALFVLLITSEWLLRKRAGLM